MSTLLRENEAESNAFYDRNWSSIELSGADNSSQYENSSGDWIMDKASYTTAETTAVSNKSSAKDVSSAEESFSDAVSNAGSCVSGPYQIIEYDFADGRIGTDFLSELEALTIEENTPAAEAIRANAQVHVSTVAKAARAVHMQAVRKFVKRATGTTKSGIVRGKPPRIPGAKDSDDDAEYDESDYEYEEEYSHSRLPGSLNIGGNLATVPEELSEHRVASNQYNLEENIRNIPENGHIPDSVVQGTVEASKKVLGAVDPHDLLRLLRWRRKKRNMQSPLTKSYVKGKVIDGEHELYTLSIAVMIGVRTSISKTNLEINCEGKRRWVQPEDFRRSEKYEFRPRGGGLTPPHQLSHTFKFKDYSPVPFAYLRRLSGVNDFDFLLSVCGNANFIEFISNAKSGQFFFYSNDGRFMIKTMTNAESKYLRRIFPQYFRHCVENPNTMMTKFFGMYRVKLYHLRRNVKFVIMNSVYYTDKYLQTFYDLKGSTIGRDAKPGQAVKKDNDLRRGLPNSALALPPKFRIRVKEQLTSDCHFLRDMGVMDYSMLVGVHHIPPSDDKSIATSGFLLSRRSIKQSQDHSFELELGSFKTLCGEGLALQADPSGMKRLSRVERSGSLLSEGTSEQRAHGHKRQDSELMNRVQVNDAIGSFFLEDGLEDDENSLLAGADDRPISHVPYNEESERKKQITIEKLYWPFHRLYDIHGHRRLLPILCPVCRNRPCVCNEAVDAKTLQGYHIPAFIPPLSQRKDGGLKMDTTGFHMPMVFKGPNGPQPFEGKIFYMGIIDILQEYTTRKALESQYRFFQSHGKPEASCVPPPDYCDRFLSFFDEYTQRGPEEAEQGVELSESSDILPDNVARLIGSSSLSMSFENQADEPELDAERLEV